MKNMQKSQGLSLALAAVVIVSSIQSPVWAIGRKLQCKHLFSIPKSKFHKTRAPGLLFGEDIKNNDPLGYINSWEGSKDNKARMSIEVADNPKIKGPLKLHGYDPQVEARSQRISGLNRNTLVNSFFKAFVRVGKETFPHISYIVNAKTAEVGEPKWLEHAEALKEFGKTYENYFPDMVDFASRGFLSKNRYEVLGQKLRETSPLYFAEGKSIEATFNYEVWSKEKQKFVKQHHKEPFSDWNTLIAEYLDAKETYYKTFGIPVEVGDAIVASFHRNLGGRVVSFSDIFTFDFWLYVIPGALNTIGGSVKGIVEGREQRKKLYGDIPLRMESQAFLLARMQAIIKAITFREENLKIPLQPLEVELRDYFIKIIGNAELAPNGDAVARTQYRMYQRERDVRNKKNLGGFDAYPLENVERFDNALHSSIEKEFESSAQYLTKFRAWIDQRRAQLAGIVILTWAANWGWNYAQFKMEESRILSYYTMTINDQAKALMTQYFNYDGDIRMLAKNSVRGWDLRNPRIIELLELRLSSYRHEWRKAIAEGKDVRPFLMDPEYQKALDELQVMLLEIRETYGLSAQYADADANWERYSYPKRITTKMTKAYKEQYPNQAQYIERIMKDFEEGGFKAQRFDYYAYESLLSSSLYRDMKYFFDKGFENAMTHYGKSGDLFSRYGEAYDLFGKAQ